MDHQPVVCDTCNGVLLATESRTYTAERGRLIVTNGYCACPSSAQTPVTASTEGEAATAPEPGAQGLPQGEKLPSGQTTMVNV